MCRELEKWSMEERQEGQRKGEDNLAKLLKLLKADGRLRDLDLAIEDEAARKALYKEYQHRLKKSPEAIEIVDSIRGFFYLKPNNIFSRDFCVYFYIFLRDFLYSYYIFPHDFLSKAIIKGDTDKTSTSQTASGGQLSYEASLFRSLLWTVRLSWPGGSGRFHTILELFCGPSPGLQDRC